MKKNNSDFTEKVKIVLALLVYIVIGIVFYLIGMEMLGTIIFAFVFVFAVLMFSKPPKEKTTLDGFNQMLANRRYFSLLKRKEEYLKAFIGNSEYFILKEYYRHYEELIINYGRETALAPLKLTKPISPYSAAYFGTRIGGLAVGMVAAQDAIEKEKAYQRNIAEVIESDLKIGNILDKIQYCYRSIENILDNNTYTKESWTKAKQQVYREMEKEYKIVKHIIP